MCTQKFEIFESRNKQKWNALIPLQQVTNYENNHRFVLTRLKNYLSLQIIKFIGKGSQHLTGYLVSNTIPNFLIILQYRTLCHVRMSHERSWRFKSLMTCLRWLRKLHIFGYKIISLGSGSTIIWTRKFLCESA